MSAMSELATELKLNWIETHDGFEHVSGEIVIIGLGISDFGLYHAGEDLLLIKRGELPTVVNHFLHATV